MVMKQRRLVRDYEGTESSAIAMVYIAMIQLCFEDWHDSPTIHDFQNRL